ncbi:MAG: hypothetical protein KIH63_003025 [Candidatus Saccharibacteria bacterium]|nr:hypothetical protein [Candidatus Saccharibacteria bacterium]
MTLKAKIKPAAGFSRIVHFLLLVLLPLLVFVFVRLRFYELAATLILLSKWRMLAVKPRHWPANIRANGVDITVSLSFLIFMMNSSSQMLQLVWTMLFMGWLIVLKPRSDQISVALQAFAAQALGISALLTQWGDASLYVLVPATWIICYAAARHFLTAYDEPLTKFLSTLWAYFAAALMWLLGHWLLFYGVVAQPTLLLTVVSLGLASIYYLDTNDKLSYGLKRQVLFVTTAVVVIVIVFSDWGDKAV